MASKKRPAKNPAKSKVFNCRSKGCDFIAKSKAGLTTHMNAKHLELSPSQLAQAKKTIKTKKNAAPAAAKPAAKGKKKKKSLGRKVDWGKAFAWYLEDATRSYSDVAKEFGVTKNGVERAAKVDYKDEKGVKVWCTWSERRQMLAEETRKQIEIDMKKSATYRSQEHLKLYRDLQMAVSHKVTMLGKQGQWLIDPDTDEKVKVQEFDAKQLADVAKALNIAINGERVVMGLPTSVSTIKPGADDETGKGWGELLALAMKQADADEQANT